MPDDTRSIADKLRAKLVAEDPNASRRSDLRERIEHLRAAQRPNEALTDRNGPTAAGHIASAITKLLREVDELRG